MATELNRDNYENETLKAEQPVLVDFWGAQCVPCLALNPAVEQIEKDYAGKLTVAKVNATENRMLCARLRVISLPTFIIYKNGSENQRLTGEKITAKDLKAAVNGIFS
ncbi:thioredoxin family protein [Chloroflexota bacterium]